MGQYSEHRRPTAVPKVDRVEREDVTGREEIRNREAAQKVLEKPKRSFAELIKEKKK